MTAPRSRAGPPAMPAIRMAAWLPGETLRSWAAGLAGGRLTGARSRDRPGSACRVCADCFENGPIASLLEIIRANRSSRSYVPVERVPGVERGRGPDPAREDGRSFEDIPGDRLAAC